ncbi:hypothetical protein DOY81_004053 [Sarcophaga bullata]|nr:hypothetical protein DOY81_004053 [Sarcophaga bullata]
MKSQQLQQRVSERYEIFDSKRISICIIIIIKKGASEDTKKNKNKTTMKNQGKITICQANSTNCAV